MNTKRGFTLIELLVVIAIIGILSSIVLASLNSARRKSRDARRVADIKQVQLANELFFDDMGSYASSTALLAPSYIAAVPTPPAGAGQTAYIYAGLNPAGGATCTDYHIGAVLEDANHIALDSDIDNVGGGTICTGGGADFDGDSSDCGSGTGADVCYDLKP